MKKILLSAIAVVAMAFTTEVYAQKKIDYMDLLPPELKMKIFSYINDAQELINYSLVNKLFRSKIWSQNARYLTMDFL